MSVYSVDGSGEFHKKKYMKDGFPQKVFKDGKLLFPDVVMINSGGHGVTGRPVLKNTIFGGNFGYNTLFQPYSSREARVGGAGSQLFVTFYDTDTVIYGDDCFLTDTYNLNGEADGKRLHFEGQNTHPLSSCGDCIAMDVSKYREYLSQLSYSSPVFLYNKISADTDSISRFKTEHNISDDDIDYGKSYNPRMCFGVYCSILATAKDENGNVVTGITTMGNNSYDLRNIPTKDGSSDATDIECLLDEETNIYYGCSNKLITSVYSNSINSFLKRYILDNDNTTFLMGVHNYRYNYVLDKIYISPHYEYLPGSIKLKNSINPSALYINKSISGEWGLAFDKETPRKLILCENLSGDTVLGYEGSVVGIDSSVTSWVTVPNNVKILTYKPDVYPFNDTFGLDFYKYCTNNGFLDTAWGNGEPMPASIIKYFPSYDDYLDGKTNGSYGSPLYLDTKMCELNPSSGLKYQYGQNSYDVIGKNSRYYGDGVNYGSFVSIGQTTLGNYNYQSKMAIKSEFDARVKFKTDENHQLPIILKDFFSDYNYDAATAKPSYYGTNSIVSSNRDLVNLCGDDWSVTDEWRHYAFTAVLDNYYNYSGTSKNGSYPAHGGALIPYICLWGECIEDTTGGKFTPYEIKNLTTEIYI